MHYFLTDLVTDIVQNGVESGTDLLELFISEAINNDGKKVFEFTVKDRGKGMTENELKLAQDPFISDGIKHPWRQVGLGIPFLIQTAENSGGAWKIASQKKTAGQGATEVNAWFDLGNVDTPPIGDIPGMFRTTLLFEGPKEVIIERRGRVNYQIRKTDLEQSLGGFKNTRSLLLLNEYLVNAEQTDNDKE